MQIVIEIPAEIYSHTQEYEVGGFNQENDTKLFMAIKNGTPLPKGHGRLGDLDALEKEIINGIKAGNYEEGYERYQHINDMDDCVECVNYADTIIEADKESEE